MSKLIIIWNILKRIGSFLWKKPEWIVFIILLLANGYQYLSSLKVKGQRDTLVGQVDSLSRDTTKLSAQVKQLSYDTIYLKRVLEMTERKVKKLEKLDKIQNPGAADRFLNIDELKRNRK